jgi:hypothetical protein
VVHQFTDSRHLGDDCYLSPALALTAGILVMTVFLSLALALAGVMADLT